MITPTECRKRAVECRQMTERASSLTWKPCCSICPAAGTGAVEAEQYTQINEPAVRLITPTPATPEAYCWADLFSSVCGMASVMGTENSFWNFPSFTVTDQADTGSHKRVDFVLTRSRAMTSACSRACSGRAVVFL